MIDRKLILRIFGFVVLPAFGALAPLLVLPSITARYGQPGWVAVALGQSLGALGSILVDLGWGITGTQRVARQAPQNRRRLLALAWTTQVVMFIPVALFTAIVAVLVARADQVEVAVIAVASAASSVSCVWYFIGTGHPMRILFTDAIPRDLPVIAVAIAIALGGPLWLFPASLIAASIVAPGIGLVVAGVRLSSFRGISLPRVVRSITRQLPALSSNIFSAAYISMSVTLVGIASPASVAMFAAADRMQRMLLSGLAAIPRSLKGWVGEPSDRTARLHRAWVALGISAAVGVVSGVLFFLLAPVASDLLFSGAVTVGYDLAWVCSLLIFIVCCSYASGGIVLVAYRGVYIIAISALGGCIVGAPLILLLSNAMGPVGGLLGETSAEATVLVIQMIGTLLLQRRDRRRVVLQLS